jgi:hypothetical protein
MNTKILVALVIGITLVGLTGTASACQTTTSDLYYQFVHTVQGQGIDIIDDMPVITSGAGWDVGGPCNDENALIKNRLVDVTANFNGDNDGIYDATLTQTGSASITKRPLDSEDDYEELEVFVGKSQDLAVSGQFTSINAVFRDRASVGVNYYDPITNNPPNVLSVSDCGNCHAKEDSYASAGVNAYGDAKISEASMGTGSWTSLSADGWTGTVIMDGGSSAYIEFWCRRQHKYSCKRWNNTYMEQSLRSTSSSIVSIK